VGRAGIGSAWGAAIGGGRREPARPAPPTGDAPAGEGPAPGDDPVPDDATQTPEGRPEAADAPLEADLAHVAAGRRRRKAPQPIAYRSAEPLPEAHRKTLQDRYGGKRRR